MEILDKIKQELKATVTNDLQLSFEQLQQTIGSDSELINTLLIHKNNYNIYSKDKLKGVISFNEDCLQRNKIISGLLSLIDNFTLSNISERSNLYLKVKEDARKSKLEFDFSKTGIDQFLPAFQQEWAITLKQYGEWSRVISKIFTDIADTAGREAMIFSLLNKGEIQKTNDIEFQSMLFKRSTKRVALILDEINKLNLDTEHFYGSLIENIQLANKFLEYPYSDDEQEKYKDFCENFKEKVLGLYSILKQFDALPFQSEFFKFEDLVKLFLSGNAAEVLAFDKNDFEQAFTREIEDFMRLSLEVFNSIRQLLKIIDSQRLNFEVEIQKMELALLEINLNLVKY